MSHLETFCRSIIVHRFHLVIKLKNILFVNKRIKYFIRKNKTWATSECTKGDITITEYVHLIRDRTTVSFPRILRNGRAAATLVEMSQTQIKLLRLICNDVGCIGAAVTFVEMSQTRRKFLRLMYVDWGGEF